MYVSPSPITFADLTKAVQSSAGLGQVPAFPTDSSGNSFADFLMGNDPTFGNAPLENAAVGVPAATTASTPPWWLLGAVVLGVFIFAGRR